MNAVNTETLFKASRSASKKLAIQSENTKNAVLEHIATLLEENVQQIIAANEIDLSKMSDQDPKKDRLLLNQDRILSLAKSTRAITQLKDPSGKTLSHIKLENGLDLYKMTVPMGVVGAIFESRPNVTIDVAALCIKSGNACILRGGTDAYETNKVLVNIVQQALQKLSLPIEIVTLFPPERALVQDLLQATKYVDLIIPRGSAELIQFVRDHSKIPTIETGAGVCHTYVGSSANLDKAVNICVNAKTTRPAVCNSLDCIIMHESLANHFLPKVAEALRPFNVEIFADAVAHKTLSELSYPFLQVAKDSDFGREFLDFKCSIKTVKNLSEALTHIENYSSRHSEAIVSEDISECEYFINAVDAASVYANASTRFTDGGVFGLGAEIGISTQKLHARGPFALEKLVTEKWIGRGNGQIRN